MNVNNEVLESPVDVNLKDFLMSALDPAVTVSMMGSPKHLVILYVIVNLWIYLKRAVCTRQPGIVKELEDFCEEEWVKIPQTKIERLFDW